MHHSRRGPPSEEPQIADEQDVEHVPVSRPPRSDWYYSHRSLSLYLLLMEIKHSRYCHSEQLHRVLDDAGLGEP